MSYSKAAITGAVLGICLSASVAPVRAGQQPQFEASVDVFRIQVALHGADGRFASGLQSGDLELLVNGVPRPIVDLVEIDAATVPAARHMMASPEDAEAGREPVGVTELRPLPGGGTAAAARRRFLILLDCASTRDGRRPAKEFLDEIAQPGDLVGFATYSPRLGMRHHVPFTSDREQIRTLIDGIGRNCAIEVETPQRLDLTLEALRSEAELEEAVDLLEEYERTRAESGADHLVSMLGGLAEALGAVQGRKHVLYFSSGLSDQLMAATGVQQELMRAAETARAGDVIFHMFEPRSLPVSSVHDLRNMGSGWQPASARGLWDTGAEVIKNRAFSYFMATETGGTASFFRHRVGPDMKEAEALSRNYYLLAFRLQPDDSEEVELEIRPRTPSVTVAWAPQRVRLPAVDGPSDVGTQIQLADALEIGNDATAMAFDLRAVPLTARDGLGRIGVAAEIPAVQLRALIEERDDDELALEFMGMVITPWGQIADYFRGTVRLEQARARFADLVAPLRYQNVLTAPPGRYFVKILVREAKVSRLASRSLSLEVPSNEGSQLSVAEPLVLAPSDGGPLIQGVDPDSPPDYRAGLPLQRPFTIRGRTLAPSAVPVAAGGEPFDVLIAVRHPTLHPFSGKTSLAAECWLEADDGAHFELPQQYILIAEEPAGDEPARLLVRLATEPSLPAGTYQLHVKVSDGISTLEAQSHSALTITTSDPG